MAAVLAFHHTVQFGSALADKYGNDPFVWVSPFLWSHCHARSRPRTFGLGLIPPFVHGKDAIFFVSRAPISGKIVCDCVFVIDEILEISVAERQFPMGHPVRHYHFDHGPRRCPTHQNSTLTRIANPKLSFVVDPPMPIDGWIQHYVRASTQDVLTYFKSKRRKNVRIVTLSADGLYDRVLCWCALPGHTRKAVLPMRSLLNSITPVHPAPGPIIWP